MSIQVIKCEKTKKVKAELKTTKEVGFILRFVSTKDEKLKLTFVKKN